MVAPRERHSNDISLNQDLMGPGQGGMGCVDSETIIGIFNAPATQREVCKCVSDPGKVDLVRNTCRRTITNLGMVTDNRGVQEFIYSFSPPENRIRPQMPGVTREAWSWLVHCLLPSL
ncbi:MAG: hypothetical protein GF416_06485 [Candidatus Altiarchaeales archaeon]|nr:hypothetical protein [Candidatus Altiarchaeales archaeon]MBD3416762.1 hypothetical protein [Candidatus Altiarchaeales archaeon]